jgi:hypothetical protein
METGKQGNILFILRLKFSNSSVSLLIVCLGDDDIYPGDGKSFLQDDETPSQDGKSSLQDDKTPS